MRYELTPISVALWARLAEKLGIDWPYLMQFLRKGANQRGSTHR